MNKRELVFIIVVIGLFAFPVFAADPTTVPPAQQQSIVGTLHAQLTLAAESQGNPNVKVWVNTNSGVYHCPGTRWYGNTKTGEYMTQKQAQEKGYRPAYGKVCR